MSGKALHGPGVASVGFLAIALFGPARWGPLGASCPKPLAFADPREHVSASRIDANIARSRIARPSSPPPCGVNSIRLLRARDWYLALSGPTKHGQRSAASTRHDRTLTDRAFAVPITRVRWRIITEWSLLATGFFVVGPLSSASFARRHSGISPPHHRFAVAPKKPLSRLDCAPAGRGFGLALLARPACDPAGSGSLRSPHAKQTQWIHCLFSAPSLIPTIPVKPVPLGPKRSGLSLTSSWRRSTV